MIPGRVIHFGTTAAAMTASNPTLASKEIAIESDTQKFKIGDGSTKWNALPYQTGFGAVPNFQQVLNAGQTANNIGGNSGAPELSDATYKNRFGAGAGYSIIKIIGSVMMAYLNIISGNPTLFLTIDGTNTFIATQVGSYISNIAAGITRGINISYNIISYGWNNGSSLFNLQMQFPTTLTANTTLNIPNWRSGELSMIGNGTSPTKTLGAGAGTGATLVFASLSDNVKGFFVLTTGTGCTGGGSTITTISYAPQYPTGSTPRVSISPVNAAAAALAAAGKMPFIISMNETNFQIASNANALADSTDYRFVYQVNF